MNLSVAAIFFAALVSGVFSKPAGLILGYQDTLGQYSFGYSAPHQARSEVRSLDGVTRGSYSYVDAAGLIQSTDYTADGHNGFRVAATNLPQAPVPVQETPEVAAARAAHLLAVQEAGQAVEVQQESEGAAAIAPKTASPEIIEKEASPSAEPAKPAEPIIEAVAEAAEATSEAKIAEAVVDEAVEKEPQSVEAQQQKGRAIEEPVHVAPVIASVAGSLPVPLIPVNFDLPAISAYSAGRPAGAKADQSLPQSTPAQGVITPAGTTLKTLTAPQIVAITPQVQLASEPAAPIAPAATSGSARDFAHFERARAVYAPVAPVSVIPLGYDPTISSFLRYAPFPYITYNIL